MDRERVAYLCAVYLNLESTRVELMEFEALLLDSEAEEFLKAALKDAYYHLPWERYQNLSAERAALIFDRIKDPHYTETNYQVKDHVECSSCCANYCRKPAFY